MGAAGKDLVRQSDAGRRENLVRQLDGEFANRDRVTPVDRTEKPGPRWSTVRRGLGEICSDFAERDTSLELVTFGLGKAAASRQAGAA
jgi:hypothetical protein